MWACAKSHIGRVLSRYWVYAIIGNFNCDLSFLRYSECVANIIFWIVTNHVKANLVMVYSLGAF